MSKTFLHVEDLQINEQIEIKNKLHFGEYKLKPIISEQQKVNDMLNTWHPRGTVYEGNDVTYVENIIDTTHVDECYDKNMLI